MDQGMTVQQVTEENKSDGLSFLIQKFFEFYSLKKLLIQKLEETQGLLDQWESALLERFTEEGVQSMKTGMGTFYQRETFRVSYDKDREPETFTWLRENDSGGIIKETINSLTLAAWAREKREQGEDLPDFFNIVLQRKIGVRSK